IAYILPIYYLLKDQMVTVYIGNQSAKEMNFGKTIAAYLAATLSLTLVMTILNYFVITPFYMQVMNFDVGNMQTYILACIIPFILFQGLLFFLLANFVLTQTLPNLVSRFDTREYSHH